MTITVLIADDQTLVRSGLRAIIESEPGMEVVGEAADGAEAVEAVRRLGAALRILPARGFPHLAQAHAASRARLRRQVGELATLGVTQAFIEIDVPELHRHVVALAIRMVDRGQRELCAPAPRMAGAMAAGSAAQALFAAGGACQYELGSRRGGS